MKMSRYTYRQGSQEYIYYGHGRGDLTPTSYHSPHPTSTMTTKQVRDLQAYAVELTREGQHAAAQAVLSLLANHG